MIGHALTQILRARGYAVEGDNHLGDWGTPFGLLIAAYKRFGWDDQAPSGSYCAAQCALCAGESDGEKQRGVRRGGAAVVSAAGSG